MADDRGRPLDLFLHCRGCIGRNRRDEVSVQLYERGVLVSCEACSEEIVFIQADTSRWHAGKCQGEHHDEPS